MELVYVGWNTAEAHLVKGLLQSAGIAAEVRSEILSGVIGEIPMTIESRPSVWVREEDAPRAKELVAEFNRERTENGEAWLCADCGEVLGCNYYGNGRWRSCGVKLLKGFPDSGTNGAFQFAGGAPGARGYVTYKAKPTRITAETNDLADEYDDYTIKTTWEPIVILEAVANVIASADIDAHTVEFITRAIEVQGFEVGSGESIRDALLRLAGYKRTMARKALMREHSIRIVQDGYAYGDAG